MRNSIFKSYAKKILKSEAFVSVIIVFVLALGIIGTSYALYMDIDSDTEYQLVEVGDLMISFENPDGFISLDNMTPTSDEIALTNSDNVFQFYIYNTGTYTVDYDIKLIPDDRTQDSDGNELNPNTVDANFINYQICKDNSDNCSDIKTLGTLDNDTITINNPIYSDSLLAKRESTATNPSAYYFLRLWINDSYKESNTGTIKYKVEVSAKNASGYLDNTNTLAGTILNSAKLAEESNSTTRTVYNDEFNLNNITGISGETDRMLALAQDDYGTSYVFRGNVNDNYVSFAGFIWRVVRINGDGTIRLILDGSLDKMYKMNEDNTTSASSAGALGAFNIPTNDNAYVGYMYGTTGSTDYDTTHKNVNDSTIKISIDNFYEQYLNSYSNYLADTLFCGDKTRASEYTTLGFGNKATYYGVYDRLYKNSSISTPTLKCASRDIIPDTGLTDEQLAYSRYTSKLDSSTLTNKGVLVNNDLKYPIALLSADELVMAGAFKSVTNNSYYLNSTNSASYWWGMTPTEFNTISYIVFSYLSKDSITQFDSSYENAGIRPVINLKANTVISGGDGTKDTTVGEGPYTIKLN